MVEDYLPIEMAELEGDDPPGSDYQWSLRSCGLAIGNYVRYGCIKIDTAISYAIPYVQPSLRYTKRVES